MEEMESRCKSLEQNLCDMLEANLQCQTEEVRLRETTVNMVDESEYSKMCDQLKDAHISLVSRLKVFFMLYNFNYDINYFYIYCNIFMVLGRSYWRKN